MTLDREQHIMIALLAITLVLALFAGDLMLEVKQALSSCKSLR